MKKAIFFLSFLSICFAKESIEVMISQDQIQKKVEELAVRLDQEYANKAPVIVMIMKGAMCFVSDLIRQMHLNVSIETIRCSSYGQNGTVRGSLTIEGLEKLDITGKDVILIDDIYDSGNTLTKAREALEKKSPASLKTIVLLLKDAARIPGAKEPDIALFPIKNEFVIGYGLDYNEHYRGLKGIYILKEEK